MREMTLPSKGFNYFLYEICTIARVITNPNTYFPARIDLLAFTRLQQPCSIRLYHTKDECVCAVWGKDHILRPGMAVL